MASQPDSAPRAEPEVFYDWSAQGQPVSVSINLNLIDRLSLEVIEGFKSLPKRGLEIGGLLLGRVEAAEHEPLVVIEDRELFQSEHLHGPSFLLSPHDREQWAALATRWGAEANPGFHAIGLFRSDTRPEHGFDDQDSSLAHELLREGAGIFLLIKPSPGGASRATFGMLQDGALKSIGEFPFQSAALQDGTHPVSGRTVNAVAAGRRAVLRRTVTAEGSQPQGKPDRRPIRGIKEGSAMRLIQRSTATPIPWRRFTNWAWILVATFMFLAAAVWKNHASPAAVRHPAMLSAATIPAVALPRADGLLSLKVDHAGRELKLTWNHSAEVIRQATYGKLEIEDGQVTEIRLEQAELLTGSIVYHPRSGDVNFQLQVFPPGGPVLESIRCLDPDYQPAARPAESIRSRRRPSRSRPVFKASAAEAMPATSTAKAPGAAPQKPVEQSPAAPPDSHAPAHSNEGGHAASAPPSSGTNAPGAVTASFEPVGPSRVRRVLGHMSPSRLVPGHENGALVPAKPVREAAPKTPPQLLRGVRGPVSVDVRVAIDKHGKVTSVSLEPPARKGPLPDAAMAAARNWTFTPAKQGSSPVASQAVLHFRFQNPYFVQADR